MDTKQQNSRTEKLKQVILNNKNRCEHLDNMYFELHQRLKTKRNDHKDDEQTEEKWKQRFMNQLADTAEDLEWEKGKIEKVKEENQRIREGLMAELDAAVHLKLNKEKFQNEMENKVEKAKIENNK